MSSVIRSLELPGCCLLDTIENRLIVELQLRDKVVDVTEAFLADDIEEVGFHPIWQPIDLPHSVTLQLIEQLRYKNDDRAVVLSF